MTKQAVKWDFFIAHAGADRDSAECLYDCLSKRSRVFLDTRCLLPGDNWDQAIADAQLQSHTTVVLISATTEQAYYQREEIAAAIDLSRRKPEEHRVIPLYLHFTGRAGASAPYGLKRKNHIAISQPSEIPSVADKLLCMLQICRNQPDDVRDIDPINARGLHRLSAALLDQVLSQQDPEGDWHHSVALTATAVCSLLDSGSPMGYSAANRATSWLARVQAATGSWGRYRSRTRYEESTGTTRFDPDWSHTISAMMAAMAMNSAAVNYGSAREWLVGRYPEERSIRGVFASADIISLAELARGKGLDCCSNVLERVGIVAGEIADDFLATTCIGPDEIDTSYQFAKTVTFQKANPSHVFAFASSLEDMYRPFGPICHSLSAGQIRTQSLAISILISLCPEQYHSRVFDTALGLAKLVLDGHVNVSRSESAQLSRFVAQVSVFSLLVNLQGVAESRKSTTPAVP